MDIFIGEMGYWLPFNPPTQSIEEQEYSNDELNTLMKSYKEQAIRHEEQYEERKRNLREIVELAEQTKKPEPEP